MARILYITHSYAPQDRRFLETIVQTHQVWLLPWTVEAHKSEMRPLPSGVQALPALNDGRQARPTKWVRSLMHLQGHLRAIKPDVIQAGPVQTGAFVAALSGFRPLIVMSWGSDVLAFPEKKRWLRWIAQFTLKRGDLVLADCGAVRDRVLSLAPLRQEQVICFPWGIDINIFRPRASGLGLRTKLGWQSKPVVISTRRFEPIQGTMVFLEAMLQVIQKRPDTRVIMVGDGSLRPQVELFIDRHSLKNVIHLSGQVPEPTLSDYYNESDLYVSATYSDGASISLLQAMACGLPVVVTRGHGNLEWVSHSLNGWLYPAGDREALATSIVEGLDDTTARNAMGRRNSVMVRERANWDENVQQLLLGYNHILNGGSPRACKLSGFEPQSTARNFYNHRR